MTPILDYEIRSWNAGNQLNVFRKMDCIQNRAMHYFCGVPRTAPLAGLMGDLGWSPGVIRRDIENIRMFNQLVRMEPRRITYQIFLYDRNSSNTKSWSANVRHICASIGKLQEWE